MKLIKAYIHHVRTAPVVQALADAGYRPLELLEVKGTLKPLAGEEPYYSAEGVGLFIGEVRVEVVCEDSQAEEVTNIIRAHGGVGPRVSGWIYISPIDQALPVGGDPQDVPKA